MKRFMIFLCLILLILPTYALADREEEVELAITAQGGFLINMQTEEVLFEKNAHERLFPASTTKIMTTIIALENGNLEDTVTVDQETVDRASGSSLDLVLDEQLNFKDLLYGVMVPSANDASMAIAKHISGSVEDFAKLMNDKAREIGASNTHYVNPSGLHHDDHYTTAYDLYLIAKYAMENELFREIMSTPQYTMPATNKSEERPLVNTNRFLTSRANVRMGNVNFNLDLDGVKGVKTGSTFLAGTCLVSYAERGGQEYMAVVLKAREDNVYVDTHILLSHAFDTYLGQKANDSHEFVGNFPVVDGSIPFISAFTDQELFLLLSKQDFSRIDKKLNIDDSFQAPLEHGDQLGTIDYYLDGDLIGQAEVLAGYSVEYVKPSTFWSKLLSNWYYLPLVLILIWLIISRWRKSTRRARRARRRKYYS